MPEGNHLRGIIHLHSCHSFDSVTSLGSIVAVAEREHLDFVVLTDHDTIAGSVALAERAAGTGLAIEVPIAAEYRTDRGDVIAAFIREEIRAKGFSDLVKEVHAQNGLVLLPHPYVGHVDVEALVDGVDMIEIFNGRTSRKNNELARQLAERRNKPCYLGSDAHLAANIANVVVSVEDKGDLATSLLAGKVEASRCSPVDWRELAFSRVIKAVKTRDLRPLLSVVWKRARRLLGQCVS